MALMLDGENGRPFAFTKPLVEGLRVGVPKPTGADLPNEYVPLDGTGAPCETFPVGPKGSLHTSLQDPRRDQQFRVLAISGGEVSRLVALAQI